MTNDLFPEEPIEEPEGDESLDQNNSKEELEVSFKKRIERLNGDLEENLDELLEDPSVDSLKRYFGIKSEYNNTMVYYFNAIGTPVLASLHESQSNRTDAAGMDLHYLTSDSMDDMAEFTLDTLNIEPAELASLFAEVLRDLDNELVNLVLRRKSDNFSEPYLSEDYIEEIEKPLRGEKLGADLAEMQQFRVFVAGLLAGNFS